MFIKYAHKKQKKQNNHQNKKQPKNSELDLTNNMCNMHNVGLY